eukprot:m.1386990 g.1386990  ORF g.1386990 m.1386990 type:complete len:65 (-) comp24979_c0_seq2:3784-3978(-)
MIPNGRAPQHRQGNANPIDIIPPALAMPKATVQIATQTLTRAHCVTHNHSLEDDNQQPTQILHN